MLTHQRSPTDWQFYELTIHEVDIIMQNKSISCLKIKVDKKEDDQKEDGQKEDYQQKDEGPCPFHGGQSPHRKRGPILPPNSDSVC